MRPKSGVTQEELTKIISVINALSSSNEKATLDTISSYLSTEAPTVDHLSQILDEAVSRGSIVKTPEDGSYQPTRSLRNRRSFLGSQPPCTLYHAKSRRRAKLSTKRINKPLHGVSSSSCNLPPKIIPVCSFCLGDEGINPRIGGPEEMLACWGCGSSAHPSCLRFSLAMVHRVKRLRWYCVDCKRCTICHYSASDSGVDEVTETDSSEAGEKDNDLLLCDNCDRGYHLSCVAPELKEPPEGTWKCPICEIYTEGYMQADHSSSSLVVNASATAPSTTQSSLDPRLQAAALCDVLTDYEMHLIRQALQSRSKTCSNFTTMSSRKPRASRSPKSEFPQRPRRSGTFVQKTLTNWTVRTQNRQKGPGTVSKVEENRMPSAGHMATRRSSTNTFDATSHRTTEDIRTTRSASRRTPAFTSTDVSPNPPVKRCKLTSSSPTISPLCAQISEQDGLQVTRYQNAVRGGLHIPSTPVPNAQEQQQRHRESRRRRCTSSAALQLVKTGIKRLCRSSTRRSLDGTSTYSENVGNPIDSLVENHAGGNDLEESISESVKKARLKDTEASEESDIKDDVDAEDIRFRTIGTADRKLFQEVQSRVQECLPQSMENSTQLPPTDNPRLLNAANISSKKQILVDIPPSKEMQSICPPRIQFGKYCITTWFSAPYPSEYARLNLLYICEYCLKYFKTEDVYKRHMRKCTTYHPPGNEIYRCQHISVFEVDGQISKLYCQQLCILAKLFLDHKTLYYDVEPFLFYVVTVHDPREGFHLVGYFSKEKRSVQKYNLSCIMVLPPYQKQAFGRFLIDFSYLLSRIEGVSGSPEKPLSDLGRLSYESYWRSALLPLIFRADEENGGTLKSDITVRQLTEATGIDVHDVVSTLQQLSSDIQLDRHFSRPILTFDVNKLSSLKTKYDLRSKNWIKVEEECLRWSPLTDTKNAKVASEGASGHSSPFVPSRTHYSSPKAVSPAPASASNVLLPSSDQFGTPTTFKPPKRRRGRPPRKLPLTSSPVPPLTLTSLQSPTNSSSSTLLEAFPLPVLDMVDPTVPPTNGAVILVGNNNDGEMPSESKSVVPPKLPSCKKDGFFIAPQRPPDSPPSGGSASSLNNSTTTPVHVTISTNSTTDNNSKVSTPNGGSGRTPSRGKGRDSVDAAIINGNTRKSTRRLLSRRGSAMRCKDIRNFVFSKDKNSPDFTPVRESNEKCEKLNTIACYSATIASDIRNPVQTPSLSTLHSSPIEAARGGDLVTNFSPPIVISSDVTSVSPSCGEVEPQALVNSTLTALPDLCCSRSHSLPQITIPSTSPPHSPLFDSTGEDVEVGSPHSCNGAPRNLHRKCISAGNLEVSGACPEPGLSDDSFAKITFSLDSSSTIPMVATPSSVSSVDTLDSEKTLPMRQETSNRRLRLIAHRHTFRRRRHPITGPPQSTVSVDCPIWKECEPLGQQEVTYIHLEAKPVVGEPLYYCHVGECQIYSATLIPHTPYSTDSLSSTSPPFVFHNSTNISPTVESLSASTSTNMFVQQTSRPLSPVFPARPLSPIPQLPPLPHDGVDGNTDSSTQSSVVYPSYTPPQPCPIYVPGVAWMTTSHFSSFVRPPTNSPPTFFNPTAAPPVFACCFPPQPTASLPPPQTQFQQVPLQTFLTQPEPALLYSPPPVVPSQHTFFMSQMNYAPAQPMPILEQQHQQQEFHQPQPNLPLVMDSTEWVFGAAPSAYPLQG